MAGEPPDGRNVPRLVGVRVECEVVWNSPQENLVYHKRGRRSARLIHTFPSSDAEAIRESLNGFLSPLAPPLVASGRTIPIRVKNSGGVAPEQREALGKLSALLERNDGERTTATGLPIDGQVVGICLGRGVSIVVRRD
jgi:hypothetical protein